MTANGAKATTALGFLTVREHEEHGLFGGYLMLNTNGRPLEFHCTAPVKANRAQEILYGPALKPFLYAEQIGQTLLTRGKVTPYLVCTNSPLMLSVREFIAAPVLLVLPPETSSRDWPTDIHRFEVGGHQVGLDSSNADDRAEVLRLWQAHPTIVSLHEPFQRIREAIDEARKSAA
jgi:hypothetical protein